MTLAVGKHLYTLVYLQCGAAWHVVRYRWDLTLFSLGIRMSKYASMSWDRAYLFILESFFCSLLETSYLLVSKSYCNWCQQKLNLLTCLWNKSILHLRLKLCDVCYTCACFCAFTIVSLEILSTSHMPFPLEWEILTFDATSSSMLSLIFYCSPFLGPWFIFSSLVRWASQQCVRWKLQFLNF